MTAAFIIIAIVTVGSAVAAMTLRNLVHCALALAITFAGLAACLGCGFTVQTELPHLGLRAVALSAGFFEDGLNVCLKIHFVLSAR